MLFQSNLHILDANVLIDANRDYYPLETVPEFWEWLIAKGKNNEVKIPIEILEELEGELGEWLKIDDNKDSLQLKEDADSNQVTKVVNTYGIDLDDIEIEKLGRDPFIISYALNDPDNRCLVTTEVSKPGKKRANRHIPDVCNDLGIRVINAFQFTKELRFSTNWNKQ